MTRPKVDPDKRQRTAQACNSCKRRKQKCNGLRPCNTCTKRGSACTYGDSDNGSDDHPSPTKRRMTDITVQSTTSMSSPANGHPKFNIQSPYAPQEQNQNTPAWTTSGPSQISNQLQNYGTSVVKPTIESMTVSPNAREDGKKATLNQVDESSQLLSRGTTVSGQDEEAVVYSNSRMLQDPTGRLLYIGDSATLSFLQLIRMIVDNVAGPSSFTMDPRRHRIVENTITLPPEMRRTHLLPDKQTANILVESFFTNTYGLIEVFHHKSFLNTLESCYADPLHIDPSWLCLLYLTLAIGLVMATPTPGTLQDAVIQKLRADSIDRAEIFYSDAKSLKDPLAGFEDGGFWSIQALTLMAVYMLAVSKRNAAYALHGMAVRSAFSLGLHREETMCIFSGAEQMVRRNLWRSLYVLDRFLATSLGRPTSIRESDCSGDALTTGEKPPFPQAPFPTAANAGFTSTLGLEATVRSCHVVGVILDKVYSQRKISTKLAQEIADHCKGWPKSLDPSLHWRQANFTDTTQGVAILHVNLFYCHSIVLLTRPFFLYLMNKLHQERKETGQRPQRQGTRMEKFGEACVIASCHSIVLVQNALEGHYLPHRNPFVLYFLFASALVVLANEFSSLFENPNANSCIENAIRIMNYCAQQDPQANRLVFILTSFREVVHQSHGLHPSTRALPSQHLSQSIANENVDPSMLISSQFFRMTFGDIFLDPTSAGHPVSIPAISGPSDSVGRHSISPTIPLNSLNQHGLGSSSNNAMSSNSTSNNGMDQDSSIRPSPNTVTQRQNSMDTFFDLARVSSNSVDGNESLGENEIDFETLWQWPNSHSSAGGGTGSEYFSKKHSLYPEKTRGFWDDEAFFYLGITLGGSIGLVSAQVGVGPLIDVQGVSDSSVPLFGMSNAEFGGN